MLFLVWASKKYLAQDVTCLEVLSQEVLPCTPQSLSPAQASPRGGPSNAEGLECTQRDSFKWTNHRCTVSWFLVETRCPSLEKNDAFHALCSFLWKWKWGCSVTSNSLQPCGLQLTRLLRPWDSRGKSTGVGCHCLLRYTKVVVIYIQKECNKYTHCFCNRNFLRKIYKIKCPVRTDFSISWG